MINTAYDDYIAKAENSITNEPKTFWSFVKSRKSSFFIPEIVRDGTTQYSDPQDVVNSFANFFSSVYTGPSIQEPDTLLPNTSTLISLKNISCDEILKASKRLKIKTTQGPDKIPCFLVRDCISAFLEPLAFIFNLSLKTNTFPNIWKEARITPVFKKGNSAEISNYRPISILSSFAKVFETAVYERVSTQAAQLITSNQHGFICKRSTITNLTCFSQYVSEALHRRQQVDTLYTDFSKAFDRVDHGLFLAKIDAMGFDNNLVSFFASYLTGRSQYVEIRGHKSASFSAMSGAPQGSNLAPLIFSLFINDILSDISSEVLLFADDLKLFRMISTTSDCLDLQTDLERVNLWCERNNLPLNIKKCYAMTYSNRSSIHYNYELNGSQLQRCSVVKDLGITYDAKLAFDTHINSICSEASKAMGFVLRNAKSFTNIQTLILLYFCYVRSKLEYGSVVWNPIYNCYIQKLEGIQRKFLKFLAFRVDGSFPPRGCDHEGLLERFEIPSLLRRRNYLLTSFLAKLLRSGIDCPELLSQIMLHVPGRIMRSPATFIVCTPLNNFLLKSPLYRAMSFYNETFHNIDIFHLSLPQLLGLFRNRLLR